MSINLTVSPSPHVHDNNTTRKLMYGVVIALIPALAVSIWYFGMGAIITTGIAVASCLIFEWLIQKFILKTKVTINDGSALVTGILFAFCLPTNLPWWMVVMGCLVSIGVGKLTFGGLGKNPFNPALVGRLFLFLSFPVQMTSWPIPLESRMHYVDAKTGATLLGTIKEQLAKGEMSVDEIINTLSLPSLKDMLFGLRGGSLGEVAALALLIGFAYMLYRKIITWHIPVSIFATVIVFTGTFWLIDPAHYINPIYHLFSGGLMLGAIFMATDYVTSPMTYKGMIIYGVGIGLITVIIKMFGAYPEGVQFAILIMNGLVPLINNYIKPQRFGKPIKQTI